MHPTLLSIGFVKIYSYGLFIALAFIVGLSYLRKKSLSKNINPHDMMDLGLYVLISAIVGSRVLYILCDYQYYLKHPLETIMLTRGGLIFYGGLLLGIVGGVICVKKKSLPLWTITDLAAPSIALGESIGRIGCFLSGCCYGKPTQMFWGVKFPTPSLAYSHYGDNFLHPTQIYTSMAALTIFAFLNWKLKHKSFTGEVFIWYLILYPGIRFIIEFFRGDNPTFILFLTMSQFISILLLLFGIFLWFKLKNKPMETLSPEVR